MMKFWNWCSCGNIMILASVKKPKSVVRFNIAPFTISIHIICLVSLSVMLRPKKKPMTNSVRPSFLTFFLMVSKLNWCWIYNPIEIFLQVFWDKNDFVGDTKESQFKIRVLMREIDNKPSPPPQPPWKGGVGDVPSFALFYLFKLSCKMFTRYCSISF